MAVACSGDAGARPRSHRGVGNGKLVGWATCGIAACTCLSKGRITAARRPDRQRGRQRRRRSSFHSPGRTGVGMDPSPFDVTRAFAATQLSARIHATCTMSVEHGSGGIWLAGRVLLNVWRLMRSELKLNIYSQQALSANVLRRRDFRCSVPPASRRRGRRAQRPPRPPCSRRPATALPPSGTLACALRDVRAPGAAQPHPPHGRISSALRHRFPFGSYSRLPVPGRGYAFAGASPARGVVLRAHRALRRRQPR